MDTSETFQLLTAPSRRTTIKLLAENDGVATLEYLSEQITAQQPNTCPNTTRITLYHHHLPKLEKKGAIEYDARSGDVVLTEAGEKLYSMLQLADEVADEIVE